MEERLIGRVQKMLVQWQTQDLRCAKCKKIRANDFLEHCACSGEWVATMSRDGMVRELRVLDRVAEFHGLRMLGGVVSDILAMV